MKYLVRPFNDNGVCDSIFETWNIVEALKKVEEQYQKYETKCIIVSCRDNIVKCTDERNQSIAFKHK